MDNSFATISVASACKVPWAQMKGGEAVRFCGVCEKNVYQLDGMSTEEVRQLVVRTEGKVCWRFFVRKDGTVLTRDCPVGLRRARQRLVGAVMAAISLALAVFGLGLRAGGFWNGSQVIGALSASLFEQSKVPEPLRSPDVAEQSHHGRLQGFSQNNAY